MERFINVAGAQTGPIARNESRQQVVSRLLELMREAKARGSDIVVFPELALTTFFPRWWMEDEAEIDSFFEREMPSPATRPLFEAAQVARHRLLSRLCRAGAGERRRRAATTPRSWSIKIGRDRRQIPQGSSARPCRAPAALSVPASGEALFRAGRSRLSGLARLRRQRRHVHLQRPALAGDLPGHGAAGRRAGRCSATTRRRTSTVAMPVYDHLPTSTTTCACRPAPTRTAPGWSAIAKAGNEEGMRASRRQLHRRALGRDRGAGDDQGRRGVHGNMRPRHQPVQQGGDVQLRPAPPHRALRADHSAGRRHPAAGLMPPRLPRAFSPLPLLPEATPDPTL